MLKELFLFSLCLIFGVVQCADLPKFPPPLFLQYPDDYCASYRKTETFDFIVVGGGTAGSVVARRLAENPSFKVLLMEAGGDPPPQFDTPGLMSIPMPATEAATTWPYMNTPSENACTGMIGGRCNFRQLKSLGGNSELNFLLYTRGNPSDYNAWEANGNPTWNYKKCLPFFKKSENLIAYTITDNATDLTVSSKYHAQGGRVSVNVFPQDQGTSEIRHGLVKAFHNNGIPKVLDINGENQIGMVDAMVTVGPDFYRMSTARAYLLDSPSNLKICKYADVDKVNFLDNRATGVSFKLRGFGHFKARARKEVIISGGTFNSPAILERSGIGSESILKKLGIPVKMNLQGVGENLHDHFVLLGDGWEVDLHSRGPLNLLTTSLTSLTGFVDLENGTSIPDIQYLFFAMPSIPKYITPPFAKLLNYNKDLTKLFTDATRKRDLLLIAPALLRPETTGSVHILSKSQDDPPDIRLKIFTNKKEVQRLTKAARFSRKIMANPAMKKFNPKKIYLKYCKDKHPDTDSDGYYECIIHRVATSLYHPTGTCKMGPKTDPNTVVDFKLRVHGIKSLRVIDASIMPEITRGNTNAPTIMIAERGAHYIKQAWRCPPKPKKKGLIAIIQKSERALLRILKFDFIGLLLSAIPNFLTFISGGGLLPAITAFLTELPLFLASLGLGIVPQLLTFGASALSLLGLSGLSLAPLLFHPLLMPLPLFSFFWV